MAYCKFGNFRENFIFPNSIKRHICDALSPQLAHDLHISAFAKFGKNITLAKISELTVVHGIEVHELIAYAHDKLKT